MKLIRSRQFKKWFTGVKDIQAKNRIIARLSRLEKGLVGHVNSIGSGASELKIDYGQGYRIYYYKHGGELILLLAGSSRKKDQQRDIDLALDILHQWRQQNG